MTSKEELEKRAKECFGPDGDGTHGPCPFWDQCKIRFGKHNPYPERPCRYRLEYIPYYDSMRDTKP